MRRLLVIALLIWAGSSSAETVLKIVPHADLKNVDPIWTTAYITRNHGYMVYDTLFAMDDTFTPRPQMVADWTVSDDGLTYSFTLREGLSWHDGTPVTAADCVASIKRWAVRDGMGQKLAAATAAMVAVSDLTFTLELAYPYGLVLESLGKISSNVPFMMPRRLAETDAFEQVSEIVGSGPFRFVAEDWVPGARVVYVRNPDYVPRGEAPRSAAGGKVVKVDRVEWLYMPDPATAINALIAGEIDYMELPPPDLLPILQAAPGVIVELVDPLGTQGWLRMNHLHPPFDHPSARRAMLWLVDQETYLRAVIGDPTYFAPCPTWYGCGSPHETDIDSAPLMAHDPAKAEALFAEAGYDGRPVVIMQPTDIALLNGASLVTAQALREIGINVQLQAMDWSTLTSRRVMKEPPDQGGWNIFHTWSIVANTADPVSNIGLSGGCVEKAWFGWPCDAELERLRDAFARTLDTAARQTIARELQTRAFDTVPYVSFGQFYTPVAYREHLSGLLPAPVPFFWNVTVQ